MLRKGKPMPEHVRQDYRRLVGRFKAARRAWKRVALLSGVAVVIVEGVGALTLAALADLLFSPSAVGRVALLAAALAVVGFFAVRHLLKPLLRTITNEQLALYLEERNPEFEGSLIAAAEFGPNVTFRGRQAEIIDSILQEAIRRVERFDLRKAIDLRRFRKYGLVALLFGGAYLALGLALPELVGARLMRILTPWKPTPEEVAARQTAELKLQPLVFTLSRGDGEMLRGSAFELEAACSRAPAESVRFHFRSFGVRGSDSPWRVLPMQELEKLHTFQAQLPDVNEEFEFFVSSGPFKSDPHRVGVYDPLVVKAFESVTKYPAYMQLPDRVDSGETPDLSAPVGSHVTLKFITNRPLQSGSLLWEKREPTPGQIEPAHKSILTASFPVSENVTFRYAISDVSGQVLESAAPVSVTAVVDRPPAVKLLKPGPAVDGNPLSEVAFLGEVSDDFGLAGGALVLVRTLEAQVAEQRFPLAFDADVVGTAVTSAKASATLALESLAKPATPGEVVTCYLELRDRMGQLAVSDLSLLNVNPFESWAYFAPSHEEAVHPQYFLEPVIAATWELRRTKTALAPKEHDQQAESIASAMVDPQTKTLVPYFDPQHVYGEKLAHGQQAMQLAQQAHDDLARHDTSAALPHLQLALAELKLAGYTEMLMMRQPPPSPQPLAEFQQQMKQATALMEKVEASNTPAKQEARPAQDAAADAAQAADLAQAQAEVVEQIKQALAQPESSTPPQPNAQAQAQSMAGKETELAQQAKRLAESVKQNAAGNQDKTAAAKELANATQTLHEAAAPLKSTRLPEALAKAESARQQLTAASEKLNANSQERVNQLLADAAAASQELHRKQENLNRQTQANPKKETSQQLGQQQVQLIGELRHVQELAAQLQQATAAGALKPEAAKHVDQALQEVKRARVEQKMTNAAVELTAANAKNATPHQAKAVEALAKVKDELLAANGARAIDPTTALAQARAQAKALQEKLEKLGAKPQPKPALQARNAEQPQPQAAAETQPQAGKKPQPKPAEEAVSKRVGSETQPTTEEQPKAKPGEEAMVGSETQPAAEEQAKPETPLSKADRKELAQEAADAAERLKEQLAARDFSRGNEEAKQDFDAFQQKVQKRKQLTDELEDMSKAPDEVARLTARVSDRLEAASEANVVAKRLFAAQREECPPQYRQLVNRYFEALSKQEK